MMTPPAVNGDEQPALTLEAFQRFIRERYYDTDKARGTSGTQDAPADLAKVQVNDLILEFNRVRVEDDGHLINLVGMVEIGKTVPLVVLREGKTVSLEITVGDRGKF